MKPLTRRRLLRWAGVAGGSLLVARWLLPRMWRVQAPTPLSERAAAFAESCFAGLDRAAVWDTHVHVVGLGAGGTGCWTHPDLQSHLHPLRRVVYELYTGAANIRDEADADRQYVRQLLALHRQANPAGKLVLFAFDWFRDEQGRPVRERSTFRVPNEYVLALAAEHAEVVPCVSVHPYRPDAADRLDELAAQGARAVKWLPNAMGMDPASPKCDAFYERLAAHGLPLISHAGAEWAVESSGTQALGNPLRLRRALDAGVRVVVAHCGSFGSAEDLDAPGIDKPSADAFDLFLRLLGEERHEGRLFADVSALSFVNRCGRPLREMLAARRWHQRLVNGSDYPLCALDPSTSTRLLQMRGYLDGEQRSLCEEIFDANPLLFDFVVKRSLSVQVEGERRSFAPSVFETARLFS